MEYPKVRGEFTPEHVRQLLKDMVEKYNWSEIWVESGWDDINVNGTITVISNTALPFEDKDFFSWVEDDDKEEYQRLNCLKDIKEGNISKIMLNPKCLYKNGVWFDA